MKIKILRTVGKKDTLPKSNDYPGSLELPEKSDGKMYTEGEIVDMKQADATKFIECGMAEQVEEPAKK